jgi:hypothetical protein
MHEHVREAVLMTPLENQNDQNVQDPVETRDASSAPVPRRKSSIWLFLLPGIILIVIGMFWMLRSERVDSTVAPTQGATGTSGAESNEGGDALPPAESLNPGAAAPHVIGDLSLIGDGAEYMGRAVELAAVPVSDVEGSRTFTVGRIGSRTLVLLDQPHSDAVAPGRRVRISGRIEAPPTGDRLEAAGLDQSDRKALEDEKVIIHATRVEPAIEATPTARPGDSQ